MANFMYVFSLQVTLPATPTPGHPFMHLLSLLFALLGAGHAAAVLAFPCMQKNPILSNANDHSVVIHLTSKRAPVWFRSGTRVPLGLRQDGNRKTCQIEDAERPPPPPPRGNKGAGKCSMGWVNGSGDNYSSVYLNPQIKMQIKTL